MMISRVMKKKCLESDVRAVIRDAALCLAAAERVIPTREAIAQKTGLTVVQIDAYFPSMDDLAIEVRKVATELFREMEEAIPQSGTLHDMLMELAGLRAKLYEAAADYRHLGDAAERFLPSVATSKAIREARYRALLAEMLEPHCLGQTTQVVAKVELITSWDSWRNLRGVQRLSVEQSVDLIQSILTAVASEVGLPA